MIQHVFKPSRIIDGRRVKARCYVGRYAETGEKPVQVQLNTPDKQIAEKRLREIVLEKQREREGIIAPKSIREAAAAQLPQLVAEYERDLGGRGLAQKHVHDTCTRLRRMVREMNWRTLGDVRADHFATWRAGLSASAKTRKEYQISINAFLNWLVRTDRLATNPLSKLDAVETRGKQVRACRAFTQDELGRLFAVAGKRKLAYQVLLYTAQRRSEVRALVWGDLHLDEVEPYALFREGTTKDKDKRAVPLRPELAQALREAKPADVDPTKKVFWFAWPTYDILRGDFKRAGIEHRDAMGRVVHFHSFRHTWQTLGVGCGVNQRSAQEILGHSDPALTAKVYTDVPALALAPEMRKIPWISEGKTDSENYSAYYAQKTGAEGRVVSLADIMHQIQLLAQATGTEGKSHLPAYNVTSCQIDEMAARAGIEPATK